jgi:secernin
MDAFLSCDTSVATGPATRDGSVIFAKNSDRPATACQPLFPSPRRQHRSGETVRCQYIEIPQVEQTWEVIGSRPYWLWGFEIGVNEWGVAIGNEAVYTREPFEDRALIGMDLVRLGLERATSAEDAIRVIGELIEIYGQGGSCDAHTFRTYHNSFIVADPTTALVLETAGRHWIAERVTDRAAISNMLTITAQGDMSSPGLVAHARDQGWSDGAFNFAVAYQDPTIDLRPRACRLDRARSILGSAHSPLSVQDMMALLRDHNGGDLPDGPRELPTLCMHGSSTLPGETAASMVVHLRPNRPRELAVTCWTAFGSPCLSIFRPVFPFGVGLPAILDQGGEQFDPASPWWVFERLQRLVAVAPVLANDIRATLQDLEAQFVTEAAATEAEAADLIERGERDRALSILRALVNSTTERSLDLAQRLTEEIAPQVERQRNGVMTAFWTPINATVGMPGGDMAAQSIDTQPAPAMSA